MLTSDALKTRNREKIMLQIYKEAESGCWQWQGQISNSGYGRIMLKTDDGNKMHSAHRASYELFIGPISKDGIITQSCKNRMCVNPEHLQEVYQVKS